MKNQKKKINIKSLLIILFIIILILILLLIVFSIMNSKDLKIAQEKLIYINDSEQWNENTIYPDYAAAFGRAYEGDLTIKDIGKSMYYVATEVLPKYYKDLKSASQEQIEKYYKNNSESIRINLAMTNSTEFSNLVKVLQSLSGDTISWKSYRIDLDTIKTTPNYTKATLYITYSENEEIAFNIIANSKINSNYSTIEYSVSK